MGVIILAVFKHSLVITGQTKEETSGQNLPAFSAREGAYKTIAMYNIWNIVKQMLFISSN